MGSRERWICVASFLMLSGVVFGQKQNSCTGMWNCENSTYAAAVTAYDSAVQKWQINCQKNNPAQDYPNGKRPPCGGAPAVPLFSSAVQSCSKNWSCTPTLYTLDYVIADLMYAPPGKASTVTYTASSGSGSSWGVSTTQGNSSTVKVSAGASGNFFGGGGFTFDASTSQASSTTNQSQFQVSSTIATSLGLASPSSDAVDHTQDEFQLWMNPQVTLTGQTNEPNSANQVNLTLSAPDPNNIVEFSVAELTGAQAVPAYKAQLFAVLSAQDKQQILQTDPYWNSPKIIANPRYVPLPCPSQGPCPSPQQLDGPDSAGDERTTDGVQLAYNYSSSSSQTNTQTTSAEVGFTVTESGGFGDFFKVSATEGESDTTSWSTSDSSGSNISKGITATATLSTTTVGYHDLIDIYFDTLYNTFVFASETGGLGIPTNEIPSVSGTLIRAGVPVANQPVVVTFSDGTSRQVFTNSRGVYRVYRAPAGIARLASANQVQTINIDPKNPIVHDIQR